MSIGVGTTNSKPIPDPGPDTDLLAAAPEGEHCSAEVGCITCGDVALPLEVIGIDEVRGLALCRDEQGRRETVEIALVLPVEPGDSLLVHAGTAISHLGRTRAPGREAEEVAGI